LCENGIGGRGGGAEGRVRNSRAIEMK